MSSAEQNTPYAARGERVGNAGGLHQGSNLDPSLLHSEGELWSDMIPNAGGRETDEGQPKLLRHEVGKRRMRARAVAVVARENANLAPCSQQVRTGDIEKLVKLDRAIDLLALPTGVEPVFPN